MTTRAAKNVFFDFFFTGFIPDFAAQGVTMVVTTLHALSRFPEPIALTDDQQRKLDHMLCALLATGDRDYIAKVLQDGTLVEALTDEMGFFGLLEPGALNIAKEFLATHAGTLRQLTEEALAVRAGH